MSSTNKTPHFGLSQWVAGGVDKPSWLNDVNRDFSIIDTKLFEASTMASGAATAATENAENISNLQTSSENSQKRIKAVESEQATIEEAIQGISLRVKANEDDIAKLKEGSGGGGGVPADYEELKATVKQLQETVNTQQATISALSEQLGAVSVRKLTETEFAQLETKDDNTLYLRVQED